jgi:hypothetical protein
LAAIFLASVSAGMASHVPKSLFSLGFEAQLGKLMLLKAPKFFVMNAV